MVFVVVPDIIREDVQGPVVAVGLLVETVPEVVLCDEVAGAGVEAAGEEAAGDEVEEGCPAKVGDEDVVEEELDEDVEEVPLGKALGADKGGAEGVEEDLECSEVGRLG
jgi:hypothetical protein